MKNTTKLKHILQLYLITLDLGDDETVILSMRDKHTGETETFADKSYSVVIAKAFGFMKKQVKFKEKLASRKRT